MKRCRSVLFVILALISVIPALARSPRAPAKAGTLETHATSERVNGDPATDSVRYPVVNVRAGDPWGPAHPYEGRCYRRWLPGSSRPAILAQIRSRAAPTCRLCRSATS